MVLQGLRELCTQHGAVLIFDEVLCGFRIAKGGATVRLCLSALLSSQASACVVLCTVACLPAPASKLQCFVKHCRWPLPCDAGCSAAVCNVRCARWSSQRHS